jgi:hypothetical protein
MKDRIELDHVVLLGRTLKEYSAYFQLSEADLHSGRILDIGAGVSSFAVEAQTLGCDVTAADPIYDLPIEVIAEKSRADLDNVLDQLPDAVHKYNWTFYRDPEELGHYRTLARDLFLKDFSSRQESYLTASLPSTGFADHEFSLVLVSYFLFLYDDLLDYDFHKRSILELARIARREARVYPLANMRATKSEFVDRLIRDPDCASLSFTVVRSDFEFLKNANELLIVRQN